ncbi:MAG: hypothetical protein FWG62_03330 [Proteobacteria bacterium]|nr:hypothetical protein [Pseudomonadota bacterium]
MMANRIGPDSLLQVRARISQFPPPGGNGVLENLTDIDFGALNGTKQCLIPFPLANAVGHDRNILNFNAKNKNIFCIKKSK